MLFGGVLLLGRQPLVHKRLFTGKFKKINTNSLLGPIANCFFLFLFCFAKNVQGSIYDICIDNNLLTHEYLHTKQRINYR